MSIARLHKPKVEFSIAVETITPETAEAWLELNIKNRHLNEAKIELYSRDMKAGRWRKNGEPIQFDVNGRLINGQHRLYACVWASVPFETAVARGVEEDAHQTIDVGMNRTFGHELSWRDEKNTTQLAAAVAVVWKYQNQAFLNPRLYASRGELSETLEAYPGIRDSIQLGGSASHILKIPASVCAGTHFLFGHLNTPEDAAMFWDLARLESAAEPGTGPYALRRYAHNTYMKKTSRPKQYEWTALAIKAFNSWMEGVPVTQLRWRRGGAQAEPFPVISTSSYIGEGE